MPVKGGIMRDRVGFFSVQSLLMLAGLWLLAMPAAAEDRSSADRVPLRSMSQAEYETYREQLQQQVKEVAATAPEQSKPAEVDEAKKEKSKSEESGYGRGYRARSERGGRTGGGYRSGSMSRGGGRGR